MRRSLLAFALVCALSLSALGGNPHQPGAPVPLPTPCPEGEVCGEDTGNSAQVSFASVIVDGALLIYSLVP